MGLQNVHFVGHQELKLLSPNKKSYKKLLITLTWLLMTPQRAKNGFELSEPRSKTWRRFTHSRNFFSKILRALVERIIHFQVRAQNQHQSRILRLLERFLKLQKSLNQTKIGLIGPNQAKFDPTQARKDQIRSTSGQTRPLGEKFVEIGSKQGQIRPK